MATKSGLTTAINGFLTAIISIAKHRSSMLELINEMYRETTTESYTNLSDNTPLTTPNGTTHNYLFKVDKIGNKVTFGGSLTNKTGAMLANGMWLTISDTEFLQNSDVVTFYGVSDNNGRNIKCTLSANVLVVVSLIDNNETIHFNMKYNTNN